MSHYNSASTVLRAFQEGAEKYGFPSKVRTDHGGENIEVWRMMLDEHDERDKCVIAGSSTHNECMRDYGVMYTDLLL